MLTSTDVQMLPKAVITKQTSTTPS